jgi:DNA polymerase I-like protein with 3'-5' exonuclease and polymerase domains
MAQVILDVETTTKNKGHVFDPQNFLVSYALKIDDEPTIWKYYTDIDFLDVLRQALSRCSRFVNFACKFDLLWIRRVLNWTPPPDCVIWDVQLGEFILSGQTLSYASLDDTLKSYGLDPKEDKVKEYWELGIDTPDIPIEILKPYNIRDVEAIYEVLPLQQQALNEKQRSLVLLEGEDMKTLMEAEWNGAKWDYEGADYALRCYKDDLDVIDQKLWTFIPEEAKAYFNWNSGDDLSLLIYGGNGSYPYATEEPAVYKTGEKKGQAYVKRSWHTKEISFPLRFKPLEGTTVKKCLAPTYKGTLFYETNEPTLKQLKSRRKEDKDLLDLLDKRAKVSKVVEMLESMHKLMTTLRWQDNLIHGQYNQNVARTGRLSSSRPNLQNCPEELDKLLLTRYE